MGLFSGTEWKIEELKDIAADLGTTFPEILFEETIRYWGESETVFDVSYDAEYVAYAFAVYDDGSTGAIEWTDFSKVFPDMSVDGSVGIEFTDTQPDLLHSVCTPDAGTGCYYQVMLETSQAMEELEKVGEETLHFVLSVLTSMRMSFWRRRRLSRVWN